MANSTDDDYAYDPEIGVPKAVLQAVFDTAVSSLDFGSGHLDNEEVEALRAVALLLGADLYEATPDNFRHQYGMQTELELEEERKCIGQRNGMRCARTLHGPGVRHYYWQDEPDPANPPTLRLVYYEWDDTPWSGRAYIRTRDTSPLGAAIGSPVTATEVTDALWHEWDSWHPHGEVV